MKQGSSRLSRRMFAAGFGGLGIAAALPIGAQPAEAASGRARWAERARTSYDALLEHLAAKQHGLFLEHVPTQPEENPYSYVWPFREATAATLDLNQLPSAGPRYEEDVVSRLETVDLYWDQDRDAYASYLPAPLGGGGDPFYDDNTVIGLEFIRRHRLSGQPGMLDLAARAFEFVIKGWDDDPLRPCPGGMHWVAADWNTVKATNVTSLASELAAHLYQATGERRYLDWALRTYDWVRDSMRTAPGIYVNSIDFEGTIDSTLWSYNSGSMIGAATLIYRATGDTTFLQKAIEDADGAVAYWSEGDRYDAQPTIFNAILFANLLLLQSVHRASDFRDLITHHAEVVWERNRDESTGLFSFQASGGGPPDPDVRPQTLNQSAAIQIFSLLGWRRADYRHAA